MENTSNILRTNTARTSKYDQAVSSMYEDTVISDVTLSSGETKVSAHRFVLYPIPFFKAMFQSNMKEATSGNIDLTKTIPEEHLKNFVEYLYCGTLMINSDNALALLHISQQLMLEDMTDAVCEYLGENISTSNCLVVLEAMRLFLELTDREMYHKTYKSFAKFFASNLEEIMKTQEFHNLPWDQVAARLSLNEHHYEQVVFEAAMMWMEYRYKPVEVKSHLRECLSDVVRLPQLPYKYLATTVMNHPILFQGEGTNQFKDLICEALVYQVTDDKPTDEVRYEKRTGYVREAYKIVGSVPDHQSLKTGYYVVEKHPSGSDTFYATNSEGYIFQSFNNKFYIGTLENQVLLSYDDTGTDGKPPKDFKDNFYNARSGRNVELTVSKVCLDSDGKEIPF